MSAIFDPYGVNAGASGAVFGLLGVLYVELFQFWQIVDRAWLELIKLTAFVVFLLALGTLPYVDNMAHIGTALYISYSLVVTGGLCLCRWVAVWSAFRHHICALHHFWQVGCISQEDFAGGVCAAGHSHVPGWLPDLLPHPNSRFLQFLSLH